MELKLELERDPLDMTPAVLCAWIRKSAQDNGADEDLALLDAFDRDIASRPGGREEAHAGTRSIRQLWAERLAGFPDRGGPPRLSEVARAADKTATALGHVSRSRVTGQRRSRHRPARRQHQPGAGRRGTAAKRGDRRCRGDGEVVSVLHPAILRGGTL